MRLYDLEESKRIQGISMGDRKPRSVPPMLPVFGKPQ